MIWVLAIVIAFVCAAVAAESEALFGFLAGLALVAAFGALNRQSRRIEALSRRLGELKSGAENPPLRIDPARTPPRGDTKDVPEAPTARTPTDEAQVASPPPLPEAMDPLPSTTAPAPPSPRNARPPRLDVAGRLRALFFEGNVPVKLGLIVSLFGVGALIRYAASHGMLDVPVSIRYALIAAAAIGLLIYGLRQAPRRPAFGLSLQGGAIGILLLTVFGSYRVPGLLPALPAFLLVVGLVGGAAVLAIRQNAAWLAAIGFLGGYLAPLLLAAGSGNHVALFTWYALLNGAVFGMAWVRPWRALNVMGFVFTFGIGALWGAQYFQPALFATTEPFLVLFFLMFVAIPVLYALKGREPGKVDATLLFGTPLVAFPMQVTLLDGERLPLAFSALAVGAVYLGLARWSLGKPPLRVLAQSMAALGLAFATLAVPLALSAGWTSATWALQGVALLWLGQAQQRRWLQAGAVALQALAGVAFLVSVIDGHDPGAGLDGRTLNLLLLGLSAGISAWLFDRVDARQRSVGGVAMASTASFWWLWIGFREVDALAGRTALDTGALWLCFVALTCLVAGALLRALPWRKPAWWPAVALPSALLGVGLAALDDPGWLATANGLALLALLAAMPFVLPAMRPTPNRLAAAHIGGLAALCAALGLGIREWLDAANAQPLGEGWHWVLPWLPLAALTALLVQRPRWAGWPVADAVHAYRRLALLLAGLVLGGVWVLTLVAGGSAAPLPWMPLLNPIELFQLVGILSLLAWFRGQPAARLPWLPSALLVGGFAALSMATLRACFHWTDPAAVNTWSGGVDWLAVAARDEAQAALSVVWAIAGVLGWVLGSRRGSRTLWTFGAALLGLVLVKLLLVDRQNLGDLLGIVSFLVVGGLLVAVGRIAPRPPRRAKEPA